MPTSTLSTAFLGTPDAEPTVHPDHPKDLDGEPIYWRDCNPAFIEGCLEECAAHYMREGLHQPLLESGAALAGHRTCVDSPDAIPFITGAIQDVNADGSPARRGFMDPCPATVHRVTQYAARKPSASPAHATPTTEEIKEAGAANVVINQMVVKQDDGKFFSSLVRIIPDADKRESLTRLAAGSGRALIVLLKAEASKATPKDRALVISTRDKFIAVGLQSELNYKSFNVWLRGFNRLNRAAPAASRPSNESVVQILHNLIYKDGQYRDKFDLRLTASPPDLTNLDQNIDVIREPCLHVSRAREQGG